MSWLLRDLIPVTSPAPFLHTVGWCFAGTLPLTAVIVLVIRFGWRRGKGMNDL